MKSVPVVQEYTTMVRNWRQHVTVPELLQGAPVKERNTFGFEDYAPRSGQFACVFFWTGPQGERLAVRFFIQPVAPVEEARYAAVQAATAGSPHFVGFRYVPDAIRRVDGSWPLVVMERAEGWLIDDFIGVNLGRKRALLEVARKWLDLLAHLQERGIAHGDLQHGNIVIDDSGRFRLVDYDGLWAESTAAMRPDESGHPNYNHPRRTIADYGREMDGFAGLVILLSILSSARDPDLWKRFRNDSEKLLLWKADFSDTSRSEAFRALQALRGTDALGDLVAHLAETLARACAIPDPNLPVDTYLGTAIMRLDEILRSVDEEAPLHMLPPALVPPVPVGGADDDAGWLGLHRQKWEPGATTPAAAAPGPQVAPAGADAALWDSMNPEGRRGFLGSLGISGAYIDDCASRSWNDLPEFSQRWVSGVLGQWSWAAWSWASDPRYGAVSSRASAVADLSPFDDVNLRSARERVAYIDEQLSALGEEWEQLAQNAKSRKRAQRKIGAGIAGGALFGTGAALSAFFVLVAATSNGVGAFIGFLVLAILLLAAGAAADVYGRGKRELNGLKSAEERRAEVEKRYHEYEAEKAALGV